MNNFIEYLGSVFKTMIRTLYEVLDDRAAFACAGITFISLLLSVYLYVILEYLKRIYYLVKLKKPGLVFISLKQGENGMLKFVLVLPEAGASDVVSREVRFSVGTELYETVLEGTAVETQEFSGNDGDAVTGSLVDVDDAGNKSEAREFVFTLVDNLAPPQPGEVGLRVTGEE